MANDNQGGRTFLAIVLGGIVLALVIAAYFMYGNKGESDVRIERPAIEQVPQTSAPPSEPVVPEIAPSETPPAAEPPPAETPEPTPN